MKRTIEASASRRLPVYLLMALLALMAGAMPAAAVDLDTMTSKDIFAMFTSEHGDGFTSIFLNQLFGPLFPTIDGTPTATVFSEIIGFFNLIILLIGGLLFFYNVTVGIMQSAHEGQVLGQRWSSLWAPLRVIFAVGMLVPVPNMGGYNLVQSGIAFIVKGSTNMASTLWAASADFVIGGEFPIAGGQPSIPPALFTKLYNNAACMAIAQHQLNVAASATGAAPLTIGFVSRGTPTQDIQYTAVLGGAGGPQNLGICGSYETPDLPDYITKVADPDDPAGLSNDASVKTQLGTIFSDTHGAALNTVMTRMLEVVGNNMAAVRDPSLPLPDITTHLEQTINETRTIMHTGMQQIRDLALGADRQGQTARDNLKKRITGSCVEDTGSDKAGAMKCYGEGWIGAGSWYMMLAQLNNEMATLTEALPEVSEGTYIKKVEAGNEELYVASGGESGWFVDERGRALEAGMLTQAEATAMQARLTSMFENSAAGLAALGMELSSHDLRSLNEDVTTEGILEKIPNFGLSLQKATEDMITFTSPSGWSADPMIGLTVIGKTFVNVAGVIMAVAGLTGFFTGGGVAVMMMPIASTLLAAGATLAYILPLMPFIIWVLAVTGFFLLIVEAVIAVNLWALAHMRMDGDGISGEAGRQGWLMMLSLFLSPVLMVFAFLMGMGIFRVTSALFDVGLRQAISGIMGGGLFTGLVALIVYSVLIAVMYIVVIERSFSLVAELPGRVLQQLGASAELTRGEDQRARVAMGAAAGSVYAGSTGAASAANKAGRAARARSDARQEAKERTIKGEKQERGASGGDNAPPAAGG